MDPISPQNVDLVRAIQALLVRQGAAIEGSALLALLGQDVEVLFQTLTSEGVKLQLPSGQTVTAQGELPYPEGTQLRVRILPAAAGESGLRLQLLEARPPAPPALLSPLVQSEAQSLATRLIQEMPPQELAPLLRLLSVLVDARPGAQANRPSPEQLQTSLRELPEPLRTSLGRALGLAETASGQELSASLETIFRTAPEADLASRLLNAGAAAGAPETDGAKSLQALVQQVLARFQPLVSQRPEIPEAHKDALMTWIRNLLQKSIRSEEPSPMPSRGAAAGKAPRAEPAVRPFTQDSLVPPKLLAALQSHTGPKAELPESWESWIRGTVQTLTDPAVSPREAPFHALQAKEGTAFFEIPLPWAQASPLQIWVEADAPEEHRGGRDATKRVLLGLKFTHLGETRLGMAQGSFGLQIRVWTEHPESLEAERDRMEEELKDLGKAVDLKFCALTYGPDGTIPSIRSLVVGPSLRALG